jgi:hypothetical protein
MQRAATAGEDEAIATPNSCAPADRATIENVIPLSHRE